MCAVYVVCVCLHVYACGWWVCAVCGMCVDMFTACGVLSACVCDVMGMCVCVCIRMECGVCVCARVYMYV